MSETETQKILDEYYAALQSGDEARLRAVVSPEIEVLYHDSTDSLPWGGRWTGYDRFRAFLAAVADNLVIENIEPLDRFVSDGTVIVLLKGRWSSRKTGKIVEATVANVFSIQDGFVCRYQVFPDSAGFGLAIGSLVPAKD